MEEASYLCHLPARGRRGLRRAAAVVAPHCCASKHGGGETAAPAGARGAKQKTEPKRKRAAAVSVDERDRTFIRSRAPH